jgi:hypothetical protein
VAPTFERPEAFTRSYERLDPPQREAFLAAVKQFVADLRAGEGMSRGLRVKRVQGTTDVWELTWAADGRATWQYGEPIHEGEPHIVWRRIGSHEIFKSP